ncbi:hypothetical protein [Amycolatopsis kentuckyensis]|uniref:hypothetical protein n=1 Tax=Amycolatopsis kentuckyensis TaxID=218823 RepID=UPI00356B5681
MGIVRKFRDGARWIENVVAVEAPRLSEEDAAAFLAELDAVAESEALVTALGSGGAVVGADPLAAALLGWRRDVDSVPLRSDAA